MEDDEETLDYFVGEIVDDVLPNRDSSIDDSVRSAFEKTFGHNWQSLPVKSVQGAVALFLLDQILSPRGITPKVLADSALELSEKLEFEERFKTFLNNVSSGGIITLEMVKSLGTSVGGSLKEAISILEAGAIVGTDFATKALKKGAQNFKNLAGKFTKKDSK